MTLYAGLDSPRDGVAASGRLQHPRADAAYEQVTLLHSQGRGAATPNAHRRDFWDTPAGGVDAIRCAAVPARTRLPTRSRAETPARPTVIARTKCGSMAVLPLIIDGRRRGVLTLRFRHPRDFDDRERTLLVDFSTAVAVAMRNASLVGDLERRATRLSAVAKVQLAMSRTELHDVYAEIYRAVASSVSNAIVLRVAARRSVSRHSSAHSSSWSTAS